MIEAQHLTKRYGTTVAVDTAVVFLLSILGENVSRRHCFGRGFLTMSEPIDRDAPLKGEHQPNRNR